MFSLYTDSFYYIELRKGDYLLLNSAKAIKREKYTDQLNNDPKHVIEGMYKVGVDIPAGEYKLIALDIENGGYWERFNGIRDNYENSIAVNTFDVSAYVTVKKGEYFYIEDAYGILQ